MVFFARAVNRWEITSKERPEDILKEFTLFYTTEEYNNYIHSIYGAKFYECKHCNTFFSFDSEPNYCPNCGNSLKNNNDWIGGVV
jgi:rubrerythrin